MLVFESHSERARAHYALSMMNRDRRQMYIQAVEEGRKRRRRGRRGQRQCGL